MAAQRDHVGQRFAAIEDRLTNVEAALSRIDAAASASGPADPAAQIALRQRYDAIQDRLAAAEAKLGIPRNYCSQVRHGDRVEGGDRLLHSPWLVEPC